MDTPRAGLRSATTTAILGVLVAFAGFSMATLQPAFADDDDWHTEADMPLAGQPRTALDHEDAQPGAASKPSRETVYAPPGLTRSIEPLAFMPTSYQTADAPRSRAAELIHERNNQ